MNEITQFIGQHEVSIRLGFFLGIFITVAAWEVAAPRRVLQLSRWIRWSNNLGLVVLNSLLLRLVFPAAAVGVAAFATQHQWGLFHYYQVSPLLATIGAIVLLDMIIYLQHVLVHAVPFLWRLHRVHHADLDYDLTTGARFHPLEIILSMLIKFAAIIVIGAPVVAVIIFEVILNGSAMFNHGNIKLPQSLDKLLRWLIVTPDMHRIHHSTADDETNSNFGFFLSVWDRIYGTYKDQSYQDQAIMPIGIIGFRDKKQTNYLPGMLYLPFVGRVKDYTINRRSWDKDSKQ